MLPWQPMVFWFSLPLQCSEFSAYSICSCLTTDKMIKQQFPHSAHIATNCTSLLALVFLVQSQEFRLLPTRLRWSLDSVPLPFHFLSVPRKSNTATEKAPYSFFPICKERPFSSWDRLLLTIETETTASWSGSKFCCELHMLVYHFQEG